VDDGCVTPRQVLRQPQTAASVELEIVPLLRGKRRDVLKRRPFSTVPFIDGGDGIQIIGTGPVRMLAVAR